MIPNKNTFCIAPYQHLDINPIGYLRVCCVSQEKSTKKYYNAQDWYKSDTLQSLRNSSSAAAVSAEV